MRDQGLARAIEAAGGVRALGRLLTIQHSAIVAWHKVPAERIVEVERVTKVPREELRPDLYR
jgi:DNA-binding transcriptional regulator YdaS (Cro superfamily)